MNNGAYQVVRAADSATGISAELATALLAGFLRELQNNGAGHALMRAVMRRSQLRRRARTYRGCCFSPSSASLCSGRQLPVSRGRGLYAPTGLLLAVFGAIAAIAPLVQLSGP
jgi:hypothetical protein